MLLRINPYTIINVKKITTLRVVSYSETKSSSDGWFKTKEIQVPYWNTELYYQSESGNNQSYAEKFYDKKEAIEAAKIIADSVMALDPAYVNAEFEKEVLR